MLLSEVLIYTGSQYSAEFTGCEEYDAIAIVGID